MLYGHVTISRNRLVVDQLLLPRSMRSFSTWSIISTKQWPHIRFSKSFLFSKSISVLYSKISQSSTNMKIICNKSMRNLKNVGQRNWCVVALFQVFMASTGASRLDTHRGRLSFWSARSRSAGWAYGNACGDEPAAFPMAFFGGSTRQLDPWTKMECSQQGPTEWRMWKYSDLHIIIRGLASGSSYKCRKLNLQGTCVSVCVTSGFWFCNMA